MVNWNDFSRESESRAISAALRQMPGAAAFEAAINRTGNVQNMNAPNVNPDAGASPVLRLDFTAIESGVLK